MWGLVGWVGGYVYGVKDKNVYVKVLVRKCCCVKVGGKKVGLREERKYPWKGEMGMKVDEKKGGELGMKIGMGGWVKGEAVG